MAALPKMVYLLACVVIANGLPRNTYKNVMTQNKVDNGEIFNTASHTQFTTYTSYGSFSNLNFSDLQYTLNSLLSNMLRNLRNSFPVVFIRPRDVFGPYFPPDVVFTADNPSRERTPKYFPTTKRVYRPTIPYPTAAPNRPTVKPTPSSTTTITVAASTKPTVAWIPHSTSKGSEVTNSEPIPESTTEKVDTEDDYDDNTRPIVLKDPSTLKNEVSDPTSRPAPNVEHGSVQSGS